MTNAGGLRGGRFGGCCHVDCKVIKVILRGFFVIFASGTGPGRKGCAKRESRREPRAMPGLKVPAPQANSVAARPCPPWSLAGVWWIDGADGIAPGGNGGEPVRSRQRARMRMRMIFKRAETLAGGAGPGRRCRGGTWGPARSWILW